MEYTDSRKNPLREGLYRDRKDKSYVLYLSQEKGKWMFQTPGSENFVEFPVNMAKEIEPIDEQMVDFEIGRFRKIVSFLEKKLEEEIEERRRL